MTARERYVTYTCEVCDQDYTTEFDADEDSWAPDRCPEHLEWVWDDAKGEYVDPEAEEEEEEEDESPGAVAARKHADDLERAEHEMEQMKEDKLRGEGLYAPYEGDDNENWR